MRHAPRSAYGRAVGEALIALGLFVLASPAPGADTQLFSRVTIFSLDGSVVETGTHEATATLDRDGAYATGTSRADFGVLSASAFASLAPTATPPAISVTNAVLMQDTLRITPAPGSVPSGTPRPIIAGGWTGVITVEGTTPQRAEFGTTVFGVPFVGDQFFATLLHPGRNEVSRTFMFGGPIELSISLLTQTDTLVASPQGPHSRTVDTTVRWEGISEVEVAGVIVPYTVTSASGTNWALAAPVPEPPIAALLALGLATVVVRVRGARVRQIAQQRRRPAARPSTGSSRSRN